MQKHQSQINLQKNKVNKKSYIWLLPVFILVFACSIFLYGAVSWVAAQSTSINATLCDHRGPEIVIVSPLDQSTVNQSVVPFKATTTRTTQVDIYVNAVYSHTIALTYGEDIETEISLSEGKNTIELRAHFSCNQTSATVSLVVLYDRDTVATADSVRPIEATKGSAAIISGVPPTGVDLVDRVTDKLTGKYLFEPDYVQFVFSWVSFLIAVSGVYIVIYPKRLGDKVLGRIKNKRLHKRINSMVRGIGLLVIVSAILMLMV